MAIGFSIEELRTIAPFIAIDEAIAAILRECAACCNDFGAVICASECACVVAAQDLSAGIGTCREFVAACAMITGFAFSCIDLAVTAVGNACGGIVCTICIASNFAGDILVAVNAVACSFVIDKAGAVTDFVVIDFAIAAEFFHFTG